MILRAPVFRSRRSARFSHLIGATCSEIRPSNVLLTGHVLLLRLHTRPRLFLSLCFPLTNKPKSSTRGATTKRSTHCVYWRESSGEAPAFSYSASVNTSCFDVRLRYRAFTCCRNFQNCKSTRNGKKDLVCFRSRHRSSNIFFLLVSSSFISTRLLS